MRRIEAPQHGSAAALLVAVLGAHASQFISLVGGEVTYRAPDLHQLELELEEADRAPVLLAPRQPLPAGTAEAHGITDAWWDGIAAVPNVSVLTFSNGLRSSDRNALGNVLLQQVRLT